MTYDDSGTCISNDMSLSVNPPMGMVQVTLTLEIVDMTSKVSLSVLVGDGKPSAIPPALSSICGLNISLTFLVS